MSRTWFAVETGLIRHPKYRGLPDSVRVTLLYVWALAGRETPEAKWEDRAFLAGLLTLYGRPDTAADLDALTAAGFLEEAADGTLEVHDWDQWQYAASKDIRDAFEADRKRRWRNAKRDPSPSGQRPDSVRTDGPTTETDKNKNIGSGQRPDRRPDASAARGAEAPDVTCVRCHEPIDGGWSVGRVTPDGPIHRSCDARRRTTAPFVIAR